jgi:hypothetical protein
MLTLTIIGLFASIGLNCQLSRNAQNVTLNFQKFPCVNSQTTSPLYHMYIIHNQSYFLPSRFKVIFPIWKKTFGDFLLYAESTEISASHAVRDEIKIH